MDAVGDGEGALSRAASRPYDAVVLDLMLPDCSGLDVLRRLRDSGCDTPVLILTARDEVSDRVEGLDSGADDYMPKPFALAELRARLRVLFRRGAAPPNTLSIGDLKLDLAARRVERAGQRVELTAREYALLEYMARNAGHVVTRPMIAEHVWETSFDTFSNVIDVYVRYLRKKIDEPFENKLIHTRRGLGYVLTPSP